MELGNKVIKCAECGNNFDFTMREQEFYKAKKFSSPKRCKVCRQKRKERLQNEKGGKKM